MTYTKEEIEAAQHVRDEIINGEMPDAFKSIYMAGEICAWVDCQKQQSFTKKDIRLAYFRGLLGEGKEDTFEKWFSETYPQSNQL